MAMIAAKGRLPDKAPQLTLDGANNRQARMSATVEMMTVRKLLARGKNDMSRDAGKTIAVSGEWLTAGPWPRGTCRKLR